MWRCSVFFTGILYLQIYHSLLLKEHLPRTQEKLERYCLEHHCERSLKLRDWSSTQESLFLLTREAGVVNFQGCGMHWYLSWLANKCTDTDSGAISNPFKSLQKLQGRSAFWFTYIDELKIKYFLNF